MSASNGSIFPENARIVAMESFAEEQYLVSFAAPKCARMARPGQFVALTFARHLLLPRPYSIMRADQENGQIEIYFQQVGEGSFVLSHLNVGDHVRCLGPIGNGFSMTGSGDLPLLLGGGVGMPPVLFLANSLVLAGRAPAMVLLGSERPLPFPVCSSQLEVPGLFRECTATLQMLENKKVPARLCTYHKTDGYFTGTTVAAAAHWLHSLTMEMLARVMIYACGPEPMLEATAALARRYKLRCELCVEEYMACSTGGCAGCAIPVLVNGCLTMQRVCVEGPVFPAQSVYFDRQPGQREN